MSQIIEERLKVKRHSCRVHCSELRDLPHGIVFPATRHKWTRPV